MEIPKKVQKLLDKRESLAEKLMIVSTDLDTWLEKMEQILMILI